MERKVMVCRMLPGCRSNGRYCYSLYVICVFVFVVCVRACACVHLRLPVVCVSSTHISNSKPPQYSSNGTLNITDDDYALANETNVTWIDGWNSALCYSYNDWRYGMVELTGYLLNVSTYDSSGNTVDSYVNNSSSVNPASLLNQGIQGKLCQT